MQQPIQSPANATLYVSEGQLFADPGHQHKVDLVEVIFASTDVKPTTGSPGYTPSTYSVFAGSGAQGTTVEITVVSEKKAILSAELEGLSLPTVFSVTESAPGNSQTYIFTNHLEQPYNTGWDKFHFDFEDGSVLDPILSIKRPT